MNVPPDQRIATPEGYEGWKAEEKLDWLWNQQGLSTPYPAVERPDVTMASPVAMAKVAVRRDTLARTLDRTDDLMEPDRPKIIHAQGAVAIVRLKIDEASPYTGVLAPSPVGGGRGVMRMSLAVPAKGKAAFTPGFGLKIPVDGRPSLDILAMNHTVGQGRDCNIFANSFTHDLSETHSELRPPQKVLQFFFRRVSQQPRRLVIDHFATTTQAGDIVAAPVRPHRLVFAPGRSVRRQFRRREPEDFRESLSRIEQGTTLYVVRSVGDDARFEGASATAESDRDIPEEGIRIGEIVLETPFVASAAGDRVFFRHTIAPESRIRS